MRRSGAASWPSLAPLVLTNVLQALSGTLNNIYLGRMLGTEALPARWPSCTVRVPTLISLGCLALLVFPLGWWFDRSLGLLWIWLAYPATYGVALLLQAAYFHGVWKRQPIRALV